MPVAAVICGTCNVAFEPKRARVPRSFCSRRCAAVAREAILKVSRQKSCQHCGEAIVGGRKRRDRKYCGRACYGATLSARRNPLTALRRKQAALACHLVSRCLNYLGRSKTARVASVLGYDRLALVTRIESTWAHGMSWENYGKGGWHVDHIRPVSSFSLEEEPAVICALDNLQALWEIENLRKGKRYGGA